MLRVANTYVTIFDIVMEHVQNAIDSNATRIGIVLDSKKRCLSVSDNGDGVDQQRFEEALSRVCASQKEAGKLGRFGIGLISPLGKCKEFTFTSCPRGHVQAYKQWTFNTEAVRRQKEDLSIPMRPMPNFAFNPRAAVADSRPGITEVPWRTKVAVQHYVGDKFISRITSIDAVIDGILERFGTAMRRKGVRLSVRFTNEQGAEETRENIVASHFEGRPLPEVSVDEKDAGTTLFRLFLARKTTKGINGRVVIGEFDNDFRFPVSSFVRSAGKLISEEVKNALQSGIFEGEILSLYAELDPDRQSFIKNAAFMGLCITIEEWYKLYGQKHLKAAKAATEDERYQDLGLKSLNVIEGLLKLPQFKDLRDTVHSFKRGTVGDGHHQPAPENIVGTQREPAVTTGAEAADPSPDSGTSDRDRAPATKENPGHEPFTVAGPRGQRRTLVKSGSVGLQFSHTAMEGSNKLYELDVREGILHFNIRHPVWVSCEDNDRRVMQLQEYIAIQALLHLSLPPDWQDVAKAAFDEQLSPFVHLLMHSNSFNMRPPSRKDP